MNGMKWTRLIGFALAVAVVGCSKTTSTEEENTATGHDSLASSWQATASLPEMRTLHAAAALPADKVLVTGGWSYNSYLSTAVVYDPAAGGWLPTGSMTTPREGHTATVLSSGRVLVAGGENAAGYTASAELYDPTTGSWSPAGATSQPRGYNTATRLLSGRVLVVGGLNSGGAQVTVDVYDPSAGTWARAAPLGTPRRSHTATLLPSGKLLVVGGWGGGATPTAELYDPATGSWSPTGSLATARYGHTATLLPNGRVLVAGGQGSGGAVGTAELYEPAAGTWSATGSLGAARHGHAATLLPNGRVLVAGGGGPSTLASAEEYEPTTGTWRAVGAMAGARLDHTVSLLESVGKVLVTGGWAHSPLLTAELYEYACDGGTCASCVSQPSGLVHWWRAEGNAADGVGLKHGTAVGGATYATGRAGSAFLLDGKDDHLTVPRISLGAFAGVTYEAWVQTTSTDAISVYPGNAALNILGDTANSAWIGFGVHGGKVRFTRAVSSSTWANLTGRLSVNDGAWHHIAATQDATGNVALYVDGTLDVTGQIAWERTYAAVDLLGAGFGLQDRFEGRLDEVSIYNRALRPTELAALYAARAGKCVGATCADGMRNGSESDIDCGGGCEGCAMGKTCGAAADCASGICSGGVCAAFTSSCKAIQASSPSAPSGTYTVDVDGSGPLAPFKAFCDMTTAGGGWTVIEKSPYGNAVSRAFYSDAPVNESAPELPRHRLSLARMTALKSLSADMRIDCRGSDYLLTAANNLFSGQGGPNSCANAARILYKAASLKGRVVTNRTLCTWFPGNSEGCVAWTVDEWGQASYCGLPDFFWTGTGTAITSSSADSFATDPYTSDTTGQECHTAGAVRHTLLR